MTTSELMKAMAEAGAPFEAILLAVQALDAKDAEIAERDAEAAEKRAKDAERKRNARSEGGFKKRPRNVRGRSTECPADPPIDNIHTPGSPSLDKSNDAPVLIEKVLSAWNETAKRGGLKPSRGLTPDRRDKAKRRLAEFGEATLIEGIRKLAASPFHCGEGSRGWKADFGWYVKSAENVTKALELEDPQKPANGASNPLLRSLMAQKPQTESLHS